MPSFEYDIRYLEAGLDLLEKYLLSRFTGRSALAPLSGLLLA
jgi:hypothetical protein